MRRSSCSQCLIRNIFLPDHFKNGIVSERVFKDKDHDGMSLTETRDEIIGQEDLEEYLKVASKSAGTKLGAAVMDADNCKAIPMSWTSSPHYNHKFGHLHVLGPNPVNVPKELRQELSRLANLTGWSRGPV